MNCEYFRDHLVAYLRGELLPKEREQMSEHSSACPKCGAEMRKTMTAMNMASVSEEAPVTRITYAFIEEALDRDASDLHFEKRGHSIRVRCRVDGVMTSLNEIVHESMPDVYTSLDDADGLLATAVMARLKGMADVDAAESEMPQKGQIGIRMDGEDYSLPVSFMPVDCGEDAVCRIIPKRAPFSLDDLGMSDHLRAAIGRMISQPMGVVLIGGPSGSGKTTVALSLAQHLASPSRKVVTIEDPVYYKMDNVTQIEVADHKGLTASALLSRAVWLAPDVVVAPLVRDGEEAVRIADLAMEGTLVIAPIHADDAAEAIYWFTHVPAATGRLLPYSCIVGAANQRLVRKTCPDCREQYMPSPDALKSLEIDPSGKTFEHGAGCEKCRSTGCRGRAQIMEALEMPSELADAPMMEKAAPMDFFPVARKAISPTLAEDGRRIVLEGITTAEEVCRVLGLPR